MAATVYVKRSRKQRKVNEEGQLPEMLDPELGNDSSINMSNSSLTHVNQPTNPETSRKRTNYVKYTSFMLIFS